MRSEEPGVEVQLVNLGGRDLAGADGCAMCLEGITPADGRFVAVRFLGRPSLPFHEDCFRRFARGMRHFRRVFLGQPVAAQMH